MVKLGLEQWDGHRAIHAACGGKVDVSHQQLSDAMCHQLICDVVALRVEAD